MTVRIQNRFGKAEPVIMGKVELLLGKLSHDVEAWAKIYAPVDTGFLMNSIRAVPENALSWLVVAGANYAAYVELPTRYTSAQPFLVPAIQTVKKLIRSGGGKSPVSMEGPATPE